MPGKSTKENETGAAEEPVVVVERQFPIVIETKKSKKKKYSKGPARSFQELEAGLTKSARKIAKAVREGLDKYAEERDQSAEDKRDGALRDILKNQSKALRKGLPLAAEAPADLLDSIANMKVVRDILDTDKNDDDDKDAE